MTYDTARTAGSSQFQQVFDGPRESLRSSELDETRHVAIELYELLDAVLSQSGVFLMDDFFTQFAAELGVL